MRPIDVTLKNAQEAYGNIRKKYKFVEKKAKYEVNQLVRISRKRGMFEKYLAGWTEKIFRIKKVLQHRKPVVYEIEDLNGEPIIGFFYEQELNPVIKNKDSEYHIERVIRCSGCGSNKKLLVKWVGYDDSFNSWITATDLKNI